MRAAERKRDWRIVVVLKMLRNIACPEGESFCRIACAFTTILVPEERDGQSPLESSTARI